MERESRRASFVKRESSRPSAQRPAPSAEGKELSATRSDALGDSCSAPFSLGSGIAPEQLERVFERFVQVDTSHTRRNEGSGLGLAISRDLARGMGGDLRARSELGRGSVFTLELAAAGAEPLASPPGSSAEKRARA